MVCLGVVVCFFLLGDRGGGSEHLSCLVFSWLPGSVVWCLTLIWEKSQLILFHIFLCSLLSFFSFWHYVYVRPLVVVPQTLDGKAFYGSMIRSQSFSELVPLDCEIQRCFSLFSVPLGGTGLGWSWIFPFSHVEG